MKNFRHENDRSNLNQDWSLDYPRLSGFSREGICIEENGSFSHPIAVEFCKQKEPGLLLKDDLEEQITDGGRYLLESVQFLRHDEWAEGREDSFHNVEFGTLRLMSSDGREFDLPVAIKPYLSGRKGLINEFSAMLSSKGLIGVDSFDPIGILNSGNSLALVTVFDPDVRSLDNIDWNNSGMEPLFDSMDIIEALQGCALTLARIHQIGAIHYDAQIKNMALAHKNGNTKIRLIDLESAKWRNTHDPMESGKFLDGVYSDMSALVGSLLGRGLWQTAGYDDKSSAIQTLLLGPYLSFLRHPVNKTDIYTTQIHEEVEQRISRIAKDI